MIENILIVSSKRILKRDLVRYGIYELRKKTKVKIIDISRLLKNKSYFLSKKISNQDIYEIANFNQLFKFLKNNKFSHSIVYTGNNIYELLVKIILFCFKIKIIRYIGAHRPNLFQSGKNVNNANNIFNKFATLFIKRKILEFLNKFLIYVVVITGEKSNFKEIYVNTAKKKIYLNSFDFNYFFRIKNRKVKKENYIVYLDQNFISHPDFLIKNRKPIVKKDFYIKLKKFFNKIEKKYKCKIKIALHPKTSIKSAQFDKNWLLYLDKTPELIKNCKHVIAHYSMSISYAVLFKKPLTFVTSNELDKFRGSQIKSLSKELNTKVINIDNENKRISISSKINSTKYQSFINNYLSHPKSNKKVNSWINLIKEINLYESLG